MSGQQTICRPEMRTIYGRRKFRIREKQMMKHLFISKLVFSWDPNSIKPHNIALKQTRNRNLPTFCRPVFVRGQFFDFWFLFFDFLHFRFIFFYNFVQSLIPWHSFSLMTIWNSAQVSFSGSTLSTKSKKKQLVALFTIL